MPACGAHAGECPQVTTSEGTFCTLSGIQLAGPAELEYDYTRAGNRGRYATSAATKSRRQAHSIERKMRAVTSPGAWRQALAKLCLNCPSRRWCCPGAAAGCRRWTVPIYPPGDARVAATTATVTSHMAEHTAGNSLVPEVPFLAQHCPAHSEYKGFGVTCRSMSVTWRAIRAKALGPGGVVKPGCELKWKPHDCNI